ncbi:MULTISPECIES: hypothetical protein [Bacillota]|uniref:hypothetical protein n=1 Tax=Bacillota TaxID=1239 RepID=UPI00242E85E5|nr:MULTISPECIES: hypothetical protein [Bacillota]
MNNFFDEVTMKLAERRDEGSSKCVAGIPKCAMPVYTKILRANVEKEYSKYRSYLNDSEYERFIEDVYNLYMDYKERLDNTDEENYVRTFRNKAVDLVILIKSYGLDIIQ